MKKTLLATGGVLAIVVAIPLAAMAGGGWRDGYGGGGPHGGMMAGGHHGGHHGGHDGDGGRHGHGGKAKMLGMLETYDANGDGQITQAEIDSFRADRLKAFDKDGDGSLTLAEYEALWLDAMREHMVDRFQGHDDDGDGKITLEEFGEQTRNAVILRDRNGDGVLSLDDIGAGGGRHGMGQGRMQMQRP